jgi:hypothetical protein
MEKTENKGIFARIYNWFVNLTVKGLLGAILVVFVLILILISASYLPRVMRGISSSLSAALYTIFVPAENATVTADKKIVSSGEDFTINFKKGDTPAGLFAVSYSCDSSANLFSVEPAGLKTIDCDTPYYLLANNTSIKIRPETEDNVVRLVITGISEDNETLKVTTVGVVRITITNDFVGTIAISDDEAEATTTTPTESNVPTYVPPQTVIQPVYYGKPDLALRLIQTGLLNGGTNMLTNQTQFSRNDMAGVKFEIRNDGDVATGPWYFTASLPSLSTPIYNSNIQNSLKPGDKIVYTLGFTNLTNEKAGLITINADPQNTVYESNEANNGTVFLITNTSRDYNDDGYNNNGCYINGVFTYNCNNYNNNYYNNNNYNDGCYVNGFFTYDCNNNYNNNWDNNDDDLDVTCYGEPDDPSTGDRVRWYADVDGGNGDYDYEWTGTNGLDSSSENPSKTYSSRGDKRATVTVEDEDGNRASDTCSVYVD